MIPAEARIIADVHLINEHHTREQVLDAIECLSRIVSPSQRDRIRVTKLQAWLEKTATTSEATP